MIGCQKMLNWIKVGVRNGKSYSFLFDARHNADGFDRRVGIACIRPDESASTKLNAAKVTSRDGYHIT